MKHAIRLNTPVAALSPNGRAHLRKVNQAKRAAKDATTVAMMLADVPRDGWGAGAVLSLVWSAKRHNQIPDDDNAWASLKAHRDAIARYIGLDDQHLSIGAFHGIVEPTTGVVLTLTRKEDDHGK